MTLHIKRVVAAMAAVLTLLTLVPTAALPTIQLPALSEQSVQTTVPADDAAPEEVPAETPDASVTTPEVSADTPDASVTTPEASADTPDASVTTPEASADTPNVSVDTMDVSTDDATANHITADKVYGPVTPEDVYTSNEGAVIDQDNTLYVDSDNDGEIEAIKGDVIEDDEDFNTDDLFQEMLDSVTVGKDPVVDTTENIEEDTVEAQEYVAESASHVDLVDGYQNNAYEPVSTSNSDHPFIPYGNAWIDLSKIKYGAPASPTYPFTKWSANTSFLNTSDNAHDGKGRATSWVFPDKDLINESIWSSKNYEQAANTSESGTTGYAYNRKDAMQGKWGITLDKNATMVEFAVDSADKTKNDDVDLSDTPWLAYSTEQEDDSQLAIAVYIGTPVAWNTNGTVKTRHYRWYTITDNNERPEVGADTMLRSMEPEVQIGSYVVGGSTENESVITNDEAYVSGAVTACIDMTSWLPIIESTDDPVDSHDYYRVSKVRIYKKGNKAARVNYLYFLNQAAPILSAQTINAAKDITTGTATTLTAPTSTTIESSRNPSKSADDKNGWLNGKAFSTYNVKDGGYGGDVDVSTKADFTTVASGGKDYVTVIIPVRKWINVASKARRLSFTIGSTTTQKPVFSIYGNNIGYSSPARDDDTGMSTSDKLLVVVGGSGTDAGPYLVHKNSSGTVLTKSPTRVDYDFSYNLDYNAHSNWYDLLDSPRIRETMVQSGTKAGWIYISEIHMVMPVGAKFNLGQLTIGNCSDSLNSGRGNSSFDGGTGVQPTVDVSNSNGYTLTNKAASFGPMLQTATFGTYDMLERSSKGGSEGYYGKMYQVTGNSPKKLYWHPGDTNTAKNSDGTEKTIATGFRVVYATAKDSSGNTWYMVGNTQGECLWTDATNIKEAAASSSGEASLGMLYDAGTWNNSDTNPKVLNEFTVDNWIVSPFGHESWGAGQLSEKESGYYYGSLFGSPSSVEGNGYANHNGFGAFARNRTGAGNCPDVTWSAKSDTGVAYQSDNYLRFHHRMSFGRTFKEPFTLTLQSTSKGYTGNAPRIRYNFTVTPYYNSTATEEDGNPFLRIGLVFAAESGSTSTYKLYYLNPTTGALSTSAQNISGTTATTYSGYANLGTAYNALKSSGTVKLVGLHIMSNYTGKGNGADVQLRNFEVLYERSGTNYEGYDQLNLNSSGEVYDNVDIISDAFHYTIAGGTSNFDSIIKQPGEKGWSIYEYDLDTSSSTWNHSASGGNVSYPQYRPSLDHLRIPVASGKSAKFIIQADRSYSTEQFKYLYISYSAIDDDGIASADDKGKTGISIALHDHQQRNRGVYISVDANGNANGLVHVPTVNDDFNQQAYSSNVNAAIDLSKLTNFKSINEVVFYIHNDQTVTTDFYINYMFLSNVEPPEYYKTQVERKVYHYYYLMDNSGDRYSCRFPTTSNPTGRITDSTEGNENARVNPLIIERGDIFYEGTYYNGVPLNAVLNADSTAPIANDSTNTSITGDNALKAVWFYQYNKSTLGEANAIMDYYQLKDGKTKINGSLQFDALWSYNRWINPSATSQRYIGYDKSSGAVSGTLMQLYATTNNVLLRSGLLPRKYQVTYDTQGGQMVYTGSSGVTDGTGFQSGIIENENNYYITQTVVLSYYQWPIDMGDQSKLVTPTKFGYTFDGWFDAPDDDLDADTKANRIYRYDTKQTAGANTLYAHWSVDEKHKSDSYTATFYKHTSNTNSKYKWFTRTANLASEFKITIPWNTKVEINGVTQRLVGWTVKNGDGKVYTPGTTLTLTAAVTFLAVTKTTEGTTCTVTMKDNTLLYLYNGGSTYTKITNGHMGITITWDATNKVRVYTNIPIYTVLMARPYTLSNTTKKTHGWYVSDHGTSAYTLDQDGSGTKGVALLTRASTKEQYTFAVSGDLTLNYVAEASTNGKRVWTMPQPIVAKEGTARQMMFYSQYEIESTDTFIECGTLYTKDTQVKGMGLTGDSSASEWANTLNSEMKFTVSDTIGKTLPETLTPKSSAVRHVKASETNAQNQYYLMVTENKGNAVTYYARGYMVFYNTNGNYYVRYSPTITYATVEAVS